MVIASTASHQRELDPPSLQNPTQTRTTHRLQKVTDFPGRSLGWPAVTARYTVWNSMNRYIFDLQMWCVGCQACECVRARVCGLVCYEPEGAAENGASFRSAHVPVICLRGHRHKQHFEKVQAFVFLHVLHVFLNVELLTLKMCLCTPTLFEMLFCFPQLKLCFYVILINHNSAAFQ